MQSVWLLGAVLAVVCMQGAVAQTGGKSQNPCVSKLTCSECIQTRTCAWCADPASTEKQRCFQPNLNDKYTCSKEFIVNMSNTYREVMSRPLQKASSSSSSSSQSNAVQVTPQHVSLKLRMNEAYKFNMAYAQAEDYPVDLYYLMDLSKSMEDDKEKLAKLGNTLSEQMQKITSNFRLGFGSFVDKVVMPYVSTVPRKLVSPCDNCVAPYGYNNHMPLSRNTTSFSDQVSKSAVSGNLDSPEGGFDAIMQAIVCKDQIGWRDQARRLLLFSTDAGFHFAGDGKLGGIVKPNDGNCHLDHNGIYTHSTLQDYPSISHINLKVKQNSINVIFAVTESQIGVYQKLQSHIEGSTAGKLDADSSNVVELVKEQYEAIRSSIEMKDNSSSNIRVKYYSACRDGDYKERNTCDGLQVGTEVNFTVEVELLSCPPKRADWKQTLRIYPVGINESLIVDLEMICDCDCERPGHHSYVKNATECHVGGDLMCGICKCDGAHYGRSCECGSESSVGSDDTTTESKDFSNCRPDNTSTADCSGQGQCVCGQCVCSTRPDPLEVISGQYCECSNFNCDYNEGLLCSGPERGVCECGACKCLAGWSGASCGCATSTETCVQPGKTKMCSGNGLCKCGACACEETTDGVYRGAYCERSPVSQCKELRDCVQCQMYKTGVLADEVDCAANCTLFTPLAEDEVVADEKKQEIPCVYLDEEDCRFSYVYGYDDDGKLVVRAQKERECPQPVFVLGVVLGVIGAIVLIGLALLLLWKLLTTIHDRREFAKFERERTLAKWDTGENPIYKQATSTFKNPTYKGK